MWAESGEWTKAEHNNITVTTTSDNMHPPSCRNRKSRKTPMPSPASFATILPHLSVIIAATVLLGTCSTSPSAAAGATSSFFAATWGAKQKLRRFGGGAVAFVQHQQHSHQTAMSDLPRRRSKFSFPSQSLLSQRRLSSSSSSSSSLLLPAGSALQLHHEVHWLEDELEDADDVPLGELIAEGEVVLCIPGTWSNK